MKYIDRIPPQALDVERTILGTIMIDRAAAEIAIQLLNEDCFYHGGHRRIFTVMGSMFERNVAIDVVSVSTELSQKGWLDEIGGDSYLSEVMESITTSGNIEYYAKILRKKAILRTLITVSGEIHTQAFDPDIEAEEALESASNKLFEMSIKSGIGSEIFNGADMARETYAEMDRISKGGVVGITTGFKEIDEIILGFCRPDFIIIAGRPGSGKTALAWNIILRQTIVHKIPILVFSIEMSKVGLGQRAFSIEGGIKLYNIRRGIVSGTLAQTLGEAASRISEAPIYGSDATGVTINHIRTVARRAIRQYGVEAIVIDHTRLMKHGQRDPVDGMTEISHGLKLLGKELNRPIIALHQIARPLKGKKVNKPRLDDLRQSGAVEEDADVVIFVHRDFYYTKKEEDRRKAEIIVEKQRNGPTGTAILNWDAEFTRFSELDESQGEEW